VRRFCQVVGHLHGESGAPSQRRKHPRQLLEVMGNPLVGRIGKYQIDIRWRRPRGGVCKFEPHLISTSLATAGRAR